MLPTRERELKYVFVQHENETKSVERLTRANFKKLVESKVKMPI